MAIKLIASDLDNTITNFEHTISKDNMEMFDTISKKDIYFTICTGKTYSIAKDICAQCKARFGIFGNGTQIIDLKTGENIYQATLSLNDFEFCYQYAKQYFLPIHIYTDNQIITEKLEFLDLRNSVLNETNSTKTNFIITPNIQEYVQKQKPPITKVVLSSKDDLSQRKEDFANSTDLSVCLIQKRGVYRDFIINKEYDYLDITPPHIDKASALNYLSNYLQIQKEEIMAVGDNLNDVDMLKYSGIGVAVANAREELKDVATYVTSQNVQMGGFAEAVKKFVI